MSASTRLMALATSLLFMRALSAIDFELAHVEDLAITLRSFPDKVVYGDPLYIELAVENRGPQTARAPLPYEGNIEFRARDEDSCVEIDRSMIRVGLVDDTFEVVDYAPGQS